MPLGLSRKNLGYTVSQSIRVTQFLTQSILSSLALGKRPSAEERKTLPPTTEILKDLKILLERDYKNIEAGIYKMPHDILQNPIRFSKQTLNVFLDLFRVRDRKARKAVKEFSPDVTEKNFPSYYAQTFHFQTDGYLSEKSANLYDHQVEMVFAGGADAMRRLALVPLYHFLQQRKKEGVGESPLKLLDVACGTGRFLDSINENYPDMALTGLDLSPWYLKKAESTLRSKERVNFVEANAESMPFAEAQFDVVTCVFLFHELPRLVRRKIALEMSRVLKPGGLLIFVDSLQLGDKPNLDGSLKFFPVNYYEPYYLDFISDDLDEAFSLAGLQRKSADLAFFSKILSFEKPQAAPLATKASSTAEKTVAKNSKGPRARKKRSKN